MDNTHRRKRTMPRGIGTIGLTLLAAAFLLAAGCREEGDNVFISAATGSSGTTGTSGSGGSSTPTTSPALQGLNLDAFHLDAKNQANDACITCHGDKTNGRAIDPATGKDYDFHGMKHDQVWFKDNCKVCHERVDLRFLSQTGGALRKTVDPAQCNDCHKTGGVAKALYK